MCSSNHMQQNQIEVIAHYQKRFQNDKKVKVNLRVA